MLAKNLPFPTSITRGVDSDRNINILRQPARHARFEPKVHLETSDISDGQLVTLRRGLAVCHTVTWQSMGGGPKAITMNNLWPVFWILFGGGMSGVCIRTQCQRVRFERFFEVLVWHAWYSADNFVEFNAFCRGKRIYWTPTQRQDGNRNHVYQVVPNISRIFFPSCTVRWRNFRMAVW